MEILCADSTSEDMLVMSVRSANVTYAARFSFGNHCVKQALLSAIRPNPSIVYGNISFQGLIDSFFMCCFA
ncbi:hypothetical protein EJD97_002645 [Solanum chilense]|uniref:Uncharacterized protein n=2 Tax=Solanum subgen. Lycopersicon TaxID=49274 RepID=A0A3Q7GAN3_SOLLC|nr:hypothetical protein EJD97_002645 [Solanum chilense]